MDIGRPTKYDDMTIPNALMYLATHADQGDPVPTVAALAITLGISRETVYAWAREHPAFSDVLDQLHAQQERALIAGGLRGAFNSPIAKLMMMKHGYSEKQEVDHRSGDGSMSPRSLDDFYAELNGTNPDADS